MTARAVGSAGEAPGPAPGWRMSGRATLFFLALSVPAQGSDALSPAYESALRRYQSGDREGAIADVSTWPERRLRDEMTALRALSGKAQACHRCPAADTWERIPVRAALMLHSDGAQRARRGGWSPLLQESAAAEVARLMKDDPSHRGFARRWYEAMASLAEAETRWAEALAWAERGLRDFPDSVEMRLVQASIEETQGSLEQSQGAPEAALERNETLVDPNARRSRAELLQRRQVRERFESAQRALRAALAVDGSLPELRLRLGRVAWRLGDAAEAQSALLDVLARKPDGATAFLAHLFLGRLHEDAGRLDDAAVLLRGRAGPRPALPVGTARSQPRAPAARGRGGRPRGGREDGRLGGPPPAARRALALSLGALRRGGGPARGVARGGRVVIGLALGLVAAASSQAPPPTFAVGVEGVYVDVFVTDGNRPVAGLTASDFELKDNGVRQPVELASVESLPLTTFLVLDTSGSVAGEKLLRLQAAGRALLGGLRADDEASLVTFDQEVEVRVPPTSDRPRLERAVGGILPGGATALYDALYAGTLLASGRGRSLLVLFTDGEDNLSWLDAGAGAARAAGVERPRPGRGHRPEGGGDDTRFPLRLQARPSSRRTCARCGISPR